MKFHEGINIIYTRANLIEKRNKIDLDIIKKDKDIEK